MLKINYEIVRHLVLSHGFNEFIRDLWDFSFEKRGLMRTVETAIGRSSGASNLVDWNKFEENFIVYWSSVAYAKDIVRMNNFKLRLPNTVLSHVVSNGYWKNRRDAHKNDMYVFSHTVADEVRGHCGPYDCMHFEHVNISAPVFVRAVCSFCGQSDKSLIPYDEHGSYYHENVSCSS
jgi:hypothetical protein